jgi:hypothetical protein
MALPAAGSKPRAKNSFVEVLLSPPTHVDTSCGSGRSPDWLKCKNPACEAVKREAEEDWGR